MWSGSLEDDHESRQTTCFFCEIKWTDNFAMVNSVHMVVIGMQTACASSHGSILLPLMALGYTSVDSANTECDCTY